MLSGHGGNIYGLARQLGCRSSEIIDMSSNVNPLGPMPGLVTFIQENINAITALPEVDAGQAVKAFADRYHVDPESVLAGNGTTQFIYTIPQALKAQKAVIIGPTYADYADACRMHGVKHTFVMTSESEDFQLNIDQIASSIEDADLVFICNPNNPTGALTSTDQLHFLCKTHPDINFIIDESYLPFVRDSRKKSMADRGLPNVIVLNSMSKIFRIPGLRIGFLIASKKIIKKLSHYQLPWSANSLAQAAVCYLMTQRAEVDEFTQKTINFLETERKNFTDIFKDISGLKLFPSTTSFVLAELSYDLKAEQICNRLAEEKILIRNCTNFTGLSDRFIRFSLKTSQVNQMLAEKLLKLIHA
ncbi:MAG: threonine-phosphate decarboxylase [Desulfobacterales bacterium]|nr:threonine-phosphate decarboxylase [Desulfobacterales bacterium]